MADQAIVHIADNSAEHVAYRLMELIADVEERTFDRSDNAADRTWILDTYAECVRAVRGHARD